MEPPDTSWPDVRAAEMTNELTVAVHTGKVKCLPPSVVNNVMGSPLIVTTKSEARAVVVENDDFVVNVQRVGIPSRPTGQLRVESVVS